ncbi:MAG TPA: aminotransferase class I/II-fold pyridoxal phosphate-dependent enzyme, partial [Epulopiscium sp.]|nr:aminotransferase class I/II-fold pyridoxal phosphate-dependent enzyme [Candidatus Epulonipiscium sp.]
MKKSSYEKLYKWDHLIELFEEFLPELVAMQRDVGEKKVVVDLPAESKRKLEALGFSKQGRNPKEVTRQLIDEVYPYRMRTNHPRYFNFIPNDISPYSVFGDFINSIHNPYGGGFSISGGTSALEAETIRWMGALIGYDREKLGGQFVSGGSMANLTALIVARDDKLKAEEFVKGMVYVSDQTHSSLAKAVHLMGLPRENVRIVPSTVEFEMSTKDLQEMIEKDIAKGLKPFLLIGSSGTTNTGSIDPLEKLGEMAKEYGLWYHVDGAYGASVLLSSHKDLLKGIEKSDSVSW